MELSSLFDRVYVVSLASSLDRRRHIVEQFHRIGIVDYEFHDAAGHNDPIVTEYYETNRVASYPPCFRCGKADCGNAECNNNLIPQQVAVFITYLQLWAKVATLKVRALICEDDVVFHPWWRTTLEKLRVAISAGAFVFEPLTPTLIRLGWALNDEHRESREFEISPDTRMSNPCHAITSAYATTLLRQFKTVNHTADVFQHQLAPVSADHAYTLFPPIAYELSCSVGSFDSLIHPKIIRSEYLEGQGMRDEAVKHRQRIKNHVRLSSHKIPPLD
jgi:GR25 family glycosyltransferase involved in LPS biosynthesis